MVNPYCDKCDLRCEHGHGRPTIPPRPFFKPQRSAIMWPKRALAVLIAFGLGVAVQYAIDAQFVRTQLRGKHLSITKNVLDEVELRRELLILLFKGDSVTFGREVTTK